jgi:hypothetical protein
MPIEIKRPVYVCGENPGMTLYKPDTDQAIAVVSYWHVTYSPFGTGNALVIWLNESNFPETTIASGGIFTDNIPLAHNLIDTLTQHFPEFNDVPVAVLPYHEARCEHTFNGSEHYIVTCNSAKNKIVVEWADLLDRKSLSWPRFPAGSQNFDLQNVICPCSSGIISINNSVVNGKVKISTLSNGHPSSTAFLAFAESWVGPFN